MTDRESFEIYLLLFAHHRWLCTGSTLAMEAACDAGHVDDLFDRYVKTRDANDSRTKAS